MGSDERGDQQERREANRRNSAFLPTDAVGDAADTVGYKAPSSEASAENWTLPGGRYTIVGEIARGGMGVVYRAIDTDLQRALAVKAMREDYAPGSVGERRFVEEARITGQLQHPGIPPVHEIGRLSDGRPFFSMKLVAGRTLAALLCERPSPQDDLSGFLKIFEQIAQALAYAHSEGIIHRDLKPANVMVGAFGEVQVMDWGLAKRLNEGLSRRVGSGQRGDERSSAGDCATDPGASVETPRAAELDCLTVFGQVMGTLAYMAPEQARGQIDALDERTDVFGLGAILCEMLTGYPPYFGPHGKKQAEEGDLREAWQRLEECGADQELVALVKECLCVRPDGRPQNGAAVAEEVAAYLASLQERLKAVEIERAAAETKAAEERKRRKLQLVVAGSVLALLAVSGVGGWWVREQSIERERLEQDRRVEKARQEERARLAVDGTLRQLVELQRRALWKQGEALLDQAERQIGAEANATLQDRLMDARRNLKFLTRLDGIRQEKGTILDGKMLGARGNSKYAEAFREFGLDILHGRSRELSEWLKESPVREDVIAALDDWALHEERLRSERLDQIIGEVTGESWREGLSRLAGDRDALRQSAENVIRTGANAALFTRLARLLDANGQEKESLLLLEAGCRRYPRDFWLHFVRGALYGRKSREEYDQAIGAFHAALAVQPESVAAWSNLGSVLDDSGDPDAAIDCLNKAIELDGKNAITHYILGNVRLGKHELDEAIACYKRAIEFDPGFGLAHSNLGIALGRKQDWQGAVASCKKAIALDYKNAKAHHNLGVTLYVMRDLEGAVPCFERAISVDPGYAAAYSGLGAALTSKRDVTGAITHLRKAVELDPKLAQAHANLGNALRAMGDLDGAILCFKKSIELAPKEALLHYNLGHALRAKPDWDGAIAAYRRAIELDGRFAEAHCNLGHVLRDRGSFREALAALEHGHKLGSQRKNWPYASVDWVKECRRLLVLDDELTAILAGEVEPADAKHRVELAEVCAKAHRRLYARAVRLYAEAFAAHPRMTENRIGGQRYKAACCAALAAGREGNDAKLADEEQRGEWRRQALDWLRAEHADCIKRLASGRSEDRRAVEKVLRDARRDADLASVRDEAALKKLSVDDQRVWRHLWAEVEELLKRTEGAGR